MAQSYEVERRMGASLLIREYFDTLPPAVADFERQVEAGRQHPQAQVEMRECQGPNKPVKLLRRWTSEGGLITDRLSLCASDPGDAVA